MDRALDENEKNDDEKEDEDDNRTVWFRRPDSEGQVMVLRDGVRDEAPAAGADTGPAAIPAWRIRPP